MLPVIQYNAEKFAKNVQICARCGQFDARSGLCNIGAYHSYHCNTGYCPQGDFGEGSEERPEVWPTAEHARAMACRACPAFAKNFCGDDGASVRDHALLAVCPQGRYADGTTGTIKSLDQPGTAMSARAATKGCCG